MVSDTEPLYTEIYHRSEALMLRYQVTALNNRRYVALWHGACVLKIREYISSTEFMSSLRNTYLNSSPLDAELISSPLDGELISIPPGTELISRPLDGELINSPLSA